MKSFKEFVSEEDLSKFMMNALVSVNSIKGKRNKDQSLVYGSKFKMKDLFKNKWQIDKIGDKEGFANIAKMMDGVEFDGKHVKLSKEWIDNHNKIMNPQMMAFNKNPHGFTKGT